VGLLTGTHTSITAVKANDRKGERGEENMHIKKNGEKILHTKRLLILDYYENRLVFAVGS